MLIDQVTITPEVTSRGVNRAVIKELVKLYRESHLGKRLPVYDGRKSLYTAGPLPFTSKEFVISLVDEEEGPGGARYLLLISRLWEVLLFCCSSFIIFCIISYITGEKGNLELSSN